MTDLKTEPPFDVTSSRPLRRERKTPKLVAAIFETATTGKTVFVPPVGTETPQEARARVSTLYSTIRRGHLRMRTSISLEPPGVYVWAEAEDAQVGSKPAR